MPRDFGGHPDDFGFGIKHIQPVNETGLTIILIEQKAELALAFANDCIVIDRGKIVHSGPSEVLKADTELQGRLLGVSH